MLRNISKVDNFDEVDEVDNINDTINVNSITGKVKVFNSFYIDDTVAEALVVIAVVAIVIIGILVVYILKNKCKLHGGYRLGDVCSEVAPIFTHESMNEKEIKSSTPDSLCKKALMNVLSENEYYGKIFESYRHNHVKYEEYIIVPEGDTIHKMPLVDALYHVYTPTSDHFVPDYKLSIFNEVYKNECERYPNLITSEDNICLLNEHDEDYEFHSSKTNKDYVLKNLIYNNMIAYNITSHNLKTVINRITYNPRNISRQRLYELTQLIYRFIFDHITDLLQFLMFSGYILTRINEKGYIDNMLLLNRRYVTDYLVIGYINDDLNLDLVYRAFHDKPEYGKEYYTVIPGDVVVTNNKVLPEQLRDRLRNLPNEVKDFVPRNIDVHENIPIIDHIPVKIDETLEHAVKSDD